MAVLSKPSKHAFYTKGESLTEQEHHDSCEINKMMKDLHRGLQVRTGPSPRFGFDDTTLDAVQFRIQKQRTEQTLKDLANGQVPEEELKHLPEEVKKKFGFKGLKKAQQKPAQNNDELNDDDKSVTAPQQNPQPKKQTSTGGTPPVRKPSESAAGD